MTPLDAMGLDLSKYKVLAVDDIPLNLLLIQKMLSKFNFQIKTASNGKNALLSVAQEKPDLILLDLMMPEIDGFEVIRRVRGNPDTTGIRIVILSALNSGEDVVKAFDLGADDFITKPIIMEKLLDCVMKQIKLAEKSKA